MNVKYVSRQKRCLYLPVTFTMSQCRNLFRCSFDVHCYWHCPRSLRSRLYANVGRPSVRLSVCLSGRRTLTLRVCYCGPGGQEISAAAAPQHGTQQQIRAVSRCQAVADPGGVQGVQTPALLFRWPVLKRTYFENMSLRFLAEQGAS